MAPSGQPPTLDRRFDVKPIPGKFAEASRSVKITVQQVQEKTEPKPASLWTPLEPDRAVSAGGATLTKQKDGAILAGGENPSPDTYTVKGEVPASTKGGMLVVSVKMTKDSRAAMTRTVWNWVEAARGEVAAKVVLLQPVVGKKTHPVCWQAWRIHVEPSARPQDFRLSVVSNMADNIEKEFNAYFIPNSVK